VEQALEGHDPNPILAQSVEDATGALAQLPWEGEGQETEAGGGIQLRSPLATEPEEGRGGPKPNMPSTS
jgi:hypothetical protein